MLSNKTNVEKSILEGCLKKRPSSQKALYDRYAMAMYNTIIRIVPQRMEAEDILQESFIKVFNNIESFKAKSTMGAWIKSICVNTCLKHLRKTKGITFVPEDNLPDLTEDLDQNELEYSVKQIHDSIKTLPAGARNIISLYLIEGYTHAEIAQINNISESTSKSQLTRAKKILARKLNSIHYEKR